MLSRPRQSALTAFALAATLEIFACPSAFAGPPTERLREFFATVNGVLVDPTTEDRPLERVARVRRLVAGVADVDGAAAAALGAAWETKTPAERDEFITLFADVLERAYVARFAGAVRTGGLAMTYGDEVVAGGEATVRAAVRSRNGHDLRVEYRMARRDGRWRVRDIVVDGVSTVENYRAQFKRLLQQGSYVTLVGQMREKLTAESLMFARSDSRPAAVSAPPPETRVIAAAPVASTPAVVEERPAPVPVPAALPPARVERARPAAPTVAAVVKSAVAVRSPAPVAAAPAPPVAVAARASVAEPGGLESALGALLLGLVGAGGASVLRRRGAKRSRAARS